MGLPLACLYILIMMLFIPFIGHDINELALYLSSLLSLFTALLLGFIDDLFDIRWRHKIPIPLIASIPTLLVYHVQGGITTVVLPRGYIVDLGALYYLYLALLPTFTTNSINILAGCNGVEAVQALIIASSILLNDALYLWPVLPFASPEMTRRHLMSAYFMLPMIGICLGFLKYNRYPARAFPGDTFCYFTGMAFAADAIQGHFSKTLVLFFLPQLFNFVLSCPQLFGLVACPRHRLPKYDPDTRLLHPSRAPLTGKVDTAVAKILSGLYLVDHQPGSCSNLTILNTILVVFGPMQERTLCDALAGVQIAGSVLAFAIRYGLGAYIYGGDRR
jgi:UDP-N-acetylglucosamine--dolichyl-phosphate N-acetylglucosaminephosphotransferase